MAIMNDEHEQDHYLASMPLVEVEETDDIIYLRLEVPGMNTQDLDVEVNEASVLIKGDRKPLSKIDHKGTIHSEFHYGTFERRIPLPAQVHTDKVQAEYTHGVLGLTLPKVEAGHMQP